MPFHRTFDSSTIFEHQGPDLETPSRSNAEAFHGSPVGSRRARRPRPTFDDGALTRTFRFPSKAYPRSSYYVTSTEIIVRIKKARRKWKLIAPKKRVVSYRTNRWFAKPRWVEIELTYTQAVKLGLAEARARIANSEQEMVTSNTSSPTQTEMSDANITCNAPSPAAVAALRGGEVVELQLDPVHQMKVCSEQEAADDFQLATDQEDAEANIEDPWPQDAPPVFHAETMVPNPAATLRIDKGTNRVAPLVSQWPHPVTTPRRNMRPVMTMLAAAIACIPFPFRWQTRLKM